MAGSRNIKKRDWLSVHQHVLRRTNDQKGTMVYIDGVKRDDKLVRKRILSVTAGGIEPLDDSQPLPPLPSYISLRSPSPGLLQIPQTDVTHAEKDLESSPKRQEERPTSVEPTSPLTVSHRRSASTTAEITQHYIATAGITLMHKLPISEFLNDCQSQYWSRPRDEYFSFCSNLSRFTISRREPSFADFSWELYEWKYIKYPGIDFDMITMLVRDGHVSIGRFLEAIIRELHEKEFEILNWLSQDIDVRQFGTRALGTAACRNNFKAVDALLLLGANINGKVSHPHCTPYCRCQISVMAYAQLPRFNEKESGASDEMIHHLLDRGAAKSIGADRCLMDLLKCGMREDIRCDELFISKVQSIIPWFQNFGDVTCETESLLETCILEAYTTDWLNLSRLRLCQYLLKEGAKTSPGSPLTACIVANRSFSVQHLTPMDHHWRLIEELVEGTQTLDAYCTSLGLNERYRKFRMRDQPYDIVQSINPLQAAALYGEEEIIRLLLKNGAKVDSPARGSCGVTPLQAICLLTGISFTEHATKLRIAKLLLDHGATVNAPPAWNLGLSALQASAFVGDIEVAKLLVDYGADVNAPGCKYGGGTALELAARKRHTNQFLRRRQADMVRFLLGAGAVCPAAGINVSPFGVMYDDTRRNLTLLNISPRELAQMGRISGTPLRNYHEYYEAEWAKDPTYVNNG